MDFFKKAQKKLESILHEKNLLNISKINDSTDNKVFIEIFSNIFIGNKLKVKEDYLDKLYVLNFSEESNNIIDFKGIKQEKIINFKNRSILSIEFSLEFINLVNDITNFNCTNEKESISMLLRFSILF